MKFIQLIAILSLSLNLYTANATDNDAAEDEYRTYCKEQVDTYAIENAEEKAVYIKECIDSFEVPADNAPQEDQ
ncbi:MAG: hypothetical protein OQK98_12835 [Gammaproteobacteria bacterium]|nr:hypothetical protein [Gammaproteobacteria bacterium]